MKREELKDKVYEIMFRQIDVVSENELCEATDEIVELWPLPPAEGAEEIYAVIEKRIERFYHNYQSYEAEELIAALEIIKRLIPPQEFATLHAQRIADKMVSEKLRGKYVFTYEELRKVCCDFFRSWWNTPGSNTDQGFDAWALRTGLKK